MNIYQTQDKDLVALQILHKRYQVVIKLAFYFTQISWQTVCARCYFGDKYRKYRNKCKPTSNHGNNHLLCPVSISESRNQTQYIHVHFALESQ